MLNEWTEKTMPAVYLLIILTCFSLLTPSSARYTPNLMKNHHDKNIPFYSTKTLKVMTLNLAHGRKDSMNQLLLSKDSIRSNLVDIAVVLQQQQADVVALQEADAPSRWSGNFNHVTLLAQQAGSPAYIQTSHASSWLFNYGTALLSRLPFTATLQHTFQPSPPTMNKGYTLGQIAWQPKADDSKAILLDLVSVHLDFSRKSIREQQAAELKETLIDRDHPMIILGDFNSDWFADEKVIRALTDNTGFHVYRPEAQDLGTYNSSNKLLDWILISEELEIRSLTILPEIVSDHSAVVAEIGLKEPIHAEK